MNQAMAKRAGHWRRYRALYLLLAVTLAPVILSYVAYYVAPPEGRTNYGTLIEPQRPLPKVNAIGLDGTSLDVQALQGKWLFVMVDGGACDEHCNAKLFHMRQQRTATGKDMDAIERVWFITDKEPLSTLLMREYEGTLFLRVDEHALRTFLPVPDAPNATLRDHIWVVDPAGNVMLRWPRNPDPKGTRSDVARLLKAASIWTRIERNP